MKYLRYVLMCGCAAAALCGCGGSGPVADGAPAGEKAGPELDGALLLDVRSPEEYAAGHLRGAVNLPHDRIAESIGELAPDKTAPVILYCRSGRRAGTALDAMRAMGYEQVQNFGGLEDAQARLGLPVEKD